MSITAFPVLARILQERGLIKTSLGATAIACAATGDVTAWTILAFVVAIAKAHQLTSSIVTIGLVLAFVGFMCFWIKPRIPRWLKLTSLENTSTNSGVMGAVLYKQRRDGRSAGFYLRICFHHRPDWNSRAVRGLSGWRRYASARRVPQFPQSPPGKFQFGFFAAVIFCFHGIAHADRAAQ
jgi:hypothetical protein